MAETRVELELRAAGGGGGGHAGRRALPAALALLLVACIGLGSGVALWDVDGPPGLIDPDEYVGDLAIVGFGILAVALVVIRALRRGVRKPDPDPDVSARLPWWGRVLALLAVGVVVLAILFLVSHLPGTDPGPEQGAPPVKRKAPPPAATERDRPPVHWWALAALGLLVAGAGTAWHLRAPPAAPEPDETDELLAAVDLSLDDLEHETDARRAVIRAYARMERALGRHGLARRPSETPFEYLGRALTSLRVGRASVERLTALFERAKFSPHEIDVSMKAEALAALAALRHELVEGAT